jgi:hypothetical protein
MEQFSLRAREAQLLQLATLRNWQEVNTRIYAPLGAVRTVLNPSRVMLGEAVICKPDDGDLQVTVPNPATEQTGNLVLIKHVTATGTVTIQTPSPDVFIDELVEITLDPGDAVILMVIGPSRYAALYMLGP